MLDFEVFLTYYTSFECREGDRGVYTHEEGSWSSEFLEREVELKSQSTSYSSFYSVRPSYCSSPFPIPYKFGSFSLSGKNQENIEIHPLKTWSSIVAERIDLSSLPQGYLLWVKKTFFGFVTMDGRNLVSLTQQFKQNKPPVFKSGYTCNFSVSARNIEDLHCFGGYGSSGVRAIPKTSAYILLGKLKQVCPLYNLTKTASFLSLYGLDPRYDYKRMPFWIYIVRDPDLELPQLDVYKDIARMTGFHYKVIYRNRVKVGCLISQNIDIYNEYYGSFVDRRWSFDRLYYEVQKK